MPDMMRNFDLVGLLPFPADKFAADKMAAAFSSIDQALSVFHAASGQPPLPPVRLTPADRLFATSTAD
jgi:hypothetical protein